MPINKKQQKVFDEANELRRIIEEMTKTIPLQVGKSSDGYWVIPEHSPGLFLIGMHDRKLTARDQWCKEQFGEHYSLEKTEWRFVFEREEDRTAFLLMWCDV